MNETLAPPPSDIDEQGVDRVQIRRMLALSPRERLQWLQEIWASIERIRNLNNVPKIR
jgi:hypothetical protein